MKTIITFSGKAEHGKTSSAIILKKILERRNYKVLLLNFADQLKFLAKQYFGWDGTKNEKSRTLLQNLGTNIVRKRDPNFWVESAVRTIKLFKEDYDYFLIGDCRFLNECELLKNSDFNVVNIKVVRLNFENSLMPEQRLHPSETSLDDFKFDYIIESESGLDNLEKEVNKFLELYKKIEN
jgi:cellulose biosynthesis protein BcsQ